MSATTEEIIRVCENLPPEKQSEVADFARFLLSQQSDDAWERLINSPQRRPRLESFMETSLREGDQELDMTKL